MSKERLQGIYKITSPTERIYIGQSRDIVRRGKRYKYHDCKKQPRLYRSLEKYGWEQHLFEVIELCNIEDLSCKERFWQDFYDVIGEKGLNCTLTECEDLPKVYSNYTLDKMSEVRKNKVFSEETRLKISESNKGKKHTEESKRKMSEAKKGKYIGEENPNFGKKHSEETRKKMSKNHKCTKGENNPNFGKPMTQEQKDKISKTRKDRKIPSPTEGKKATQETKDKISNANKGKRTRGDSPHAKKVLDVSTGIIYNSIREFFEELGISYYIMTKEIRKESGKFKFVEDEV